MDIELESPLPPEECEWRLRKQLLPLWRLYTSLPFRQNLRMYGRVRDGSLEATAWPTALFRGPSPWFSGRFEGSGSGTRISGVVKDFTSIHRFPFLILFAGAFAWFALLGSAASWAFSGALPSSAFFLVSLLVAALAVGLAWVGRNWFVSSDLDRQTLISLLASAMDASESPRKPSGAIGSGE